MTDRDLEAYVVRLLSAVYPDARQTNNSGAVSANGDVLAGPWLADAKGTEKGTGFNITQRDFVKSRREAWHHRREVLFVRSNCANEVLVALDLTLFVELMQALQTSDHRRLYPPWPAHQRTHSKP